MNGAINYGPDTSEPFDFRTRATYSCSEGFYLPVGGNAERICEGDGSSTSGVWSGTAPPICLGIFNYLYTKWFMYYTLETLSMLLWLVFAHYNCEISVMHLNFFQLLSVQHSLCLPME